MRKSYRKHSEVGGGYLIEGAQAMSLVIAVIVGIFVLGTRPPLADTGTAASVAFRRGSEELCIQRSDELNSWHKLANKLLIIGYEKIRAGLRRRSEMNCVRRCKA